MTPMTPMTPFTCVTHSDPLLLLQVFHKIPWAYVPKTYLSPKKNFSSSSSSSFLKYLSKCSKPKAFHVSSLVSWVYAVTRPAAAPSHGCCAPQDFAQFTSMYDENDECKEKMIRANENLLVFEFYQKRFQWKRNTDISSMFWRSLLFIRQGQIVKAWNVTCPNQSTPNQQELNQNQAKSGEKTEKTDARYLQDSLSRGSMCILYIPYS